MRPRAGPSRISEPTDDYTLLVPRMPGRRWSPCRNGRNGHHVADCGEGHAGNRAVVQAFQRQKDFHVQLKGAGTHFRI